jgi:predicted Zn-dependent peptidase
MESAGSRDAIGMAAELRRLGAALSVEADRDEMWISLDVHADRLVPALALLADALLRPQLNEDDWSRVHAQQINQVEQNREDPPQIAVDVMGLLYFNEGDAMAHPLAGTPATLGAVTLEGVRAWHRRLIDTSGATVVVVGDLDPAEAREALDAALADWRPTTAPAEPRAAARNEGHIGRLFLLDVPGAEQTAIRVMGPGYDVAGPDRAPALMANLVLGGTFGARLNLLMREQKGYTYGVRSSFFESLRGTQFMFRTTVEVGSTAEALADMTGVLEAASAGYTAEELETSHRQARSAAVTASETRSALAEALAARATLRRSPESWLAEIEAQEATTAEELQTATQRYIVPAQMVTLLVGDRAVIEPQLRAANLTFVVITLPE